MAARNDDFGGHFLDRLKLSVHSIITLCNKYKLPAELLVMEWNPPKDRQKLKDSIEWPSKNDYVSIRFIEISHEIHATYKNSERIPFFEFPAKNAGIRRANGEYILVTNSDIIFSDEMIKYLSKQPLSHDAFYRTDRYDVRGPMPPNMRFEDQIRFCKNNAIIVQTMHGAIFLSDSEWFKQKIVDRIRRITLKKIIEKVKRHFSKKKTATEIIEEKQKAERFRGLAINVGGDFMMLTKEKWHKLRGYPNVGVDRGLDCYMTIMAHIAGLLQVLVPYPIYHIEHDRSVQYDRPTAVLEDIPEFEKMISTEQPVIVNDSNWGLADKNLPETTV